jgi:sensor histidine kinase YesM
MFTKRFKQFTGNQIVQQVFFWAVSFFVLLRLFTRTGEIRTIDVIYTSLFHFPLLVGVIWNQIALRHFLEKGLRWAYFFAFLLAVLFIIQIYPLTFDLLAGWIFPEYYFITVYEWYEIGGIGLIYVSLNLLLYLAKGWFKQQESVTQLAVLEEEKTSNELRALRAQINPHFLFNSLNTIYGEALKKTDKAPQLILELSDILRYVVENMSTEAVPLSDEIGYLNKFINLQKQRSEHPERIRFKAAEDPGNHSIPPLLLITFVENCFKHGSISEEGEFIHINLSVNENELILSTRNSVSGTDTLPEKGSKTGLTNARRRLELAYPGKHQLDYEQLTDEFQLTLTLTF